MNVLSLFDGISSGRLALERAGIEVENYFSSEIDKYCIEVAQDNFPDTIQLGDVVNVKGEDLPEIDLVMGGSPCQGFSIAGNQLNFQDPRSKLFFEYVRLIEEVKPKYFLLENVRMKPDWQDLISSFVGVEPILINSRDFSAQDRKRLYWSNIKIDKNFPADDTILEDILEDEVDMSFCIDPLRSVIILEKEVKRRKIGYIGADSQANRIYNIHGKAVSLCGEAGGLGARTGLYAFPCLTPDRLDIRQNGRRFKPPSSKFFSLTAMDKHGILTNNFIRKLTPIECERLQTVPDDYTSCLSSNNQRYRMLGNGWTVDVIAYILKGIKDG